MAKRVFALVAAVAMVGIALLVRGGDTEPPDDGGPSTGDGSGDAQIVCAADFDVICGAADVANRTERAGTTADRLLDARAVDELEGEAWIVTSAWADLVLAERVRLGRPALFAIDPTPLARSPIVTVVWQDRATELEARCGAVDWACLAANDGTTLDGGDRVQSALPLVDTATGLVVAAHQAAGLLGRTDFAANDFDAGFLAAARSLAGDQRRTPVLALRSRGPGELTAVGATAVQADPLSSNFGSLTALPLEPATYAQVVALVPAGSSLDAGTRESLARAFAEAGFEPVPADGAGLPSGGVLAAIRTLWNDGA